MQPRDTWLADAEWQRIQEILPIACVDAFAIRPGETDADLEIGLILRATPDEGRRWTLIGGRLLYGESILEGLQRHVSDSLGSNIAFETTSGDQPLYVAQYAPEPRPGFARDIRRHAVALTFAITLQGEVRTIGSEALDFGWFQASALPVEEIGFGQATVIVTALAARPSPPPAPRPPNAASRGARPTGSRRGVSRRTANPGR